MLRHAAVLLTFFTLITGVGYPAAITFAARLLFPAEASGSLIRVDGVPVGSALIGQSFTSPAFFWSRPSATAPTPYNAAASAGSNLGPTNPALREVISARVSALNAAGGNGPVPVDLVTTSASGLDPDISVAAALYQVPRVAQARRLSESAVRELVQRHTASPPFAPARVNVLQLNLALGQTTPR